MVGLNDAQPGRFSIAKVRTSSSASVASGANSYVWPTTALVAGVPSITGTVFAVASGSGVALLPLSSSSRQAARTTIRSTGNARVSGCRFVNVGSSETRRVRQAPARTREAEEGIVREAMPHRTPRLWQPRYPGQVSFGPEALRPRLTTGLPNAELRERHSGPVVRHCKDQLRAGRWNCEAVGRSRPGRAAVPHNPGPRPPADATGSACSRNWRSRFRHRRCCTPSRRSTSAQEPDPR